MAYFTGTPSFIAIAGGIASHSPGQSSSLRAHCTHMNYISLKDTIPGSQAALMDVMDDVIQCTITCSSSSETSCQRPPAP